MSSDSEASSAPEELADYPEYELAALFDDIDRGEEVTIFNPAGDQIISEWITADADDTTSLDEVR